jgi:hypothetical protein
VKKTIEGERGMNCGKNKNIEAKKNHREREM